MQLTPTVTVLVTCWLAWLPCIWAPIPAGGKPVLLNWVLSRRAERCGCANGARFYEADRSQTKFHGLRHELHNLAFVAKDALILGRLVMLDTGPRIATFHNFGVLPPRQRWADYIDLETSTFGLFDPQGKAICDGLLADCAIDSIAEPEVRAAVDASVAANPQSRAITDVGSVNTAVGGDAEFEHFQFLVRDYGDYAVHSKTPFGMALANHTLRLQLVPSKRVADLASRALFWLRVNGGTPNVIVMHVRRGDKAAVRGRLTEKTAVVPGLNESTSSENLLRVLHAVAPPGSATVYIMSNEWQPNFFDAVRNEYTVFQWKDLHDLRALGGPCVDGDGATSTDDVDDLLPRLPREDSSESSGCDSITLYSVEEYLRQLVPPNRRIVTFEDDLDFRWRPSGLTPFLHPSGKWTPPEQHKWCKRIGDPCLFHSHCCSVRCRRDGVGTNQTCHEWYPSPHIHQVTVV